MSAQGSAGGVLRIDEPDWSSNAEAYSFPPIIGERVSILITKNTDRTVTVVVKGPFGKTFEFREPILRKDRVPFESAGETIRCTCLWTVPKSRQRRRRG